MERKGILIADSDDQTMHMLKQQLESLGYAIIGNARTTAEIFNHVRYRRPDLIIINVRLLDTEECELMRKIHAPLLAIAPFTDKRDEDRAIRSGALCCLRIPIDHTQIAPAVEIAAARFRDIRALEKRIDVISNEINERAIIDRAKYILMQRYRLSERDAYNRLRRHARNTQKKMSDIARQIITELSQ